MNKTRRITLIGMFSAIAYIFTLIGHFVPISFAGFLNYDPKDAIIVIAGFSVGPLASLIISVIVASLELITISGTGFVGFLMNIISSATFACVAAIIYKKMKSIRGAAIGLFVSSVATVCMMLLWNYAITPLYNGYPREVVAAMLIPVFLPFNVIKCGLNSALTLLIYKPCVQALRGIGLMPREKSAQRKNAKFSVWITVSALSLMAVMIALFIILK